MSTGRKQGGRPERAYNALREAQQTYNDGLRHHRAGRLDAAIAHYQRALALRPDYAAAHNNLGVLLAGQGRADEAMAHYRRALALDPNYADAHNNAGNICKNEGRFEEAMAHYEAAIAVEPSHAGAHLNRTEIKTFSAGDADLAALETLAAGDDLSASKSIFIHFALAKAFEDIGDYDRAFGHLRRGNALKRRELEYDEQRSFQLLGRISTVFGQSLFDQFEGAGDPSPAPVFVLGMPRSGSSLIEQILASHPQILGAGELTDLEIAAASVLQAANIRDADGRPVPFPESVRGLDGAALRRIGESYLARLPALAGDQLRIVNKLPNNFSGIGLIWLALPNARIIHTVRNPVDTCVSCYSKLFRSGLPFTYDMGELGRYYRHYGELMSHWREVLPADAMLDVVYEDVVDDLEGQARRLIDYCGLPWDDRCMSFHRTTRTVKTASAVQVRQPLFRSSLRRWRKYEGHLAPLLDELKGVSPGYAAAGAGDGTDALR